LRGALVDVPVKREERLMALAPSSDGFAADVFPVEEHIAIRL